MTVDCTKERDHLFKGRVFIIIDKMKVLKEVKRPAKSLMTRSQARLKTRSGPGQVARLVGALSCTVKGCGFNPWLGHIWEGNR